MPSIESTINIAKGALAAQRYGLNVAGHNIANVDNPSFSKQAVPHIANDPMLFRGMSFGTGVDIKEVQRSSNDLLERRLVEQASKLKSFEETDTYMNIMESFFDENSDSSVTNLMLEFWNSWHDLSDKPNGASERVSVLENGKKLVDRFHILNSDLDQMGLELTREIESSVSQINSITKDIARLNQDIVSSEGNSTANDLRDTRNSLLNSLSELVDTYSFEQPDGSLTITTSGGHLLVSGVATYGLNMNEGQVGWEASYGGVIDITDKIGGGKIAGWLNMRDEVLPKYKEELNVLAKEFIWTVNKQHSQGVGLDYFRDRLDGTYETDDSHLFATLTYGNKIDYDKDLKVWVKDESSLDAQNVPLTMNMGVSEAKIGNLQSVATTPEETKYKFTVEQGVMVGDYKVTETNGYGLGVVQSGNSVEDALDYAIAEQKITLYGESIGTQVVEVKDVGGEAKRSAKSVAEALNALKGVKAYASKNSVDLNIENVLVNAGNDVHAGDEISFSLVSGGNAPSIRFTVDEDNNVTRKNFLASVNEAIQYLNKNGSKLFIDSDLLDAQNNQLTITSEDGDNIGIEDFVITDNTNGVFGGNYTGFDVTPGGVGDHIRFDMRLDQNIVANIDLDLSQIAEATGGLVDNPVIADEISKGFNQGEILKKGEQVTLTDADGNRVMIKRFQDSFEFLTTNGTSLNLINFEDDDASGLGNSATLPISVRDGAQFSDGTSTPVNFTAGGAGAGTRIDMEPKKYSPSSDGIFFEGVPVIESGGTGFKSSVKTGTVTVVLDPEMTIRSSAESFKGSLFNVRADEEAVTGNSIITLGGEGGFEGFSANDVVSFNVVIDNGPPLVTAPVRHMVRDTKGTFGGNYLDRGFNYDSINGGDTVSFDLMLGGTALQTITVDLDTLAAANGGEVTNQMIADTISAAINGGTALNDGESAEILDVSGNKVTITRNGNGFAFETTGDKSFNIDNVVDDDKSGADSRPDLFVRIPDEVRAQNLEKTLGTYGVLNRDLFTVSRNGASVSILRKDGKDIEIVNFGDSNTSLDFDSAALAVRTGTGLGTNAPVNTKLEANNQFKGATKSTLYESEGIIKWEKFDKNGISMGKEGLINVSDDATYSVIEDGKTTLTFDLSGGELVAGNTLTVNTDETGKIDPLAFTVASTANSIMDTYKFTVVKGGKVGSSPAKGEEPITINWVNSVDSGTIYLEGSDPPRVPVVPETAVVDGMTLNFTGGTLFEGDVFTVMTDDTGRSVTRDAQNKDTGETLSDWHWTLDSFSRQFNKMAPGIKAEVTEDNSLSFVPDDEGFKIEDVKYSELNGFNEANTTLEVVDYTALRKPATEFRLYRNEVGIWTIQNDFTAGAAQIVPQGGDDDRLGVDFTGDGIADIRIQFNVPVSGRGFVEFNIRPRNPLDYSFAFSDDTSEDSGVISALGINTFFDGMDIGTVEVNNVLKETKYITAARIDGETGEFGPGDGFNALAMADLQFQSLDLRQWNYARGTDAVSNLLTSSLEDYYYVMTGSMGIKAKSVKHSLEFGEVMSEKVQEQRDAISSVSLDEEMINMIKYQHAYTAASKLITVSDEMLNTLINMR